MRHTRATPAGIPRSRSRLTRRERRARAFWTNVVHRLHEYKAFRDARDAKCAWLNTDFYCQHGIGGIGVARQITLADFDRVHELAEKRGQMKDFDDLATAMKDDHEGDLVYLKCKCDRLTPVIPCVFCGFDPREMNDDAG